VLAISVDDRTKAQQVWQQVLAKHFSVLSDPGAVVIRKYGLLHPHGGQGQDIALDTTLFIDGKGVERWRKVSQTLPDLPTADEVLTRIRREGLVR
jgi:peroxiredoxin